GKLCLKTRIGRLEISGFSMGRCEPSVFLTQDEGQAFTLALRNRNFLEPCLRPIVRLPKKPGALEQPLNGEFSHLCDQFHAYSRALFPRGRSMARAHLADRGDCAPTLPSLAECEV